MEAILEHTRNKQGVFKYLVKWIDQTKNDSWITFITASNICPILLKKYNNDVDKAEAEKIAVKLNSCLEKILF